MTSHLPGVSDSYTGLGWNATPQGMGWSIVLGTKESGGYNLEVWGSSLPLGQNLTNGKQEMGGSLAHKFSTLPSMNCLKAQFIHTACAKTSTDILTKWTHLPNDLLCLFVAHCKTLSHSTLHCSPSSLPYPLYPHSHRPGFVPCQFRTGP